MPSTAKATTSQRNIISHFSSTAASMASMAKTAPVAVRRCTKSAFNWRVILGLRTFGLNLHSCLGMGLVVNLHKAGGIDCCIGLCRTKRGMTQQFLDRPQVAPCVQQVSGKAVAH